MSYSNNITDIIETLSDTKNSFYLLNNTVSYALNASGVIVSNADSIIQKNKNYIDEKFDDMTNFARQYIIYQEQNIDRFVDIKSAEEIQNNQTINDKERTTKLYDDIKTNLQEKSTHVDSEKQFKIVAEELASVQRKINSHQATADDLQKNADLLNEYDRLTDEVYGEQMKETSFRFEQRNKDLIHQIEVAEYYAQYDETWAGELARLKTLAGYYLDDINHFKKNETEAYSANDLVNLIKQAQEKALSNYNYDLSKKLARAVYKINPMETYRLDLTVGNEKLTIFVDKSIEDFIAKLQSIGLIN